MAYISGSPASSYSEPIWIESDPPSPRVTVILRHSGPIPYCEKFAAESLTNVRALTFESLLRTSLTAAKSALAVVPFPTTSHNPPESLWNDTVLPPFEISSAVARSASKRKNDLSRSFVWRFSRFFRNAASSVKSVGLSSRRAYTCEPSFVLEPMRSTWRLLVPCNVTLAGKVPPSKPASERVASCGKPIAQTLHISSRNASTSRGSAAAAMGVSIFHLPPSRTSPTRRKFVLGSAGDAAIGRRTENAETSKRGMSNTSWFRRRSISTISPSTNSLSTTTILSERESNRYILLPTGAPLPTLREYIFSPLPYLNTYAGSSSPYSASPCPRLRASAA